MLQAVIDNWTIMKGNSPDALREGFFQREGKLSKKGNGWNLQVEKKTIDILLNKLPWGLGLVRLPWLEELIFVEWK